MERAGRRRTFDGVRLRRTSPGLARAALWLALVCACVPFLPELLASGRQVPGGAALLAVTRDAVAYWFVGAGVLVVAAWLASRGMTQPVVVALDSRCLYVATKRLERRTPRWMIQDVVAPRRMSGSSSREVRLHLSSGRTVHLVFDDAARARELTDALGQPPATRRATAGNRSPATAGSSSRSS